jgi:hypothetical protein
MLDLGGACHGARAFARPGGIASSDLRRTKFRFAARIMRPLLGPPSVETHRLCDAYR